jgi:[histone H3]-lysine36 N-dimethyltransferase NSD2
MVKESLNLAIESTKPTILPLSSKAIKNINVKREVIDQPQKLKKKNVINDEHNSQLKTKKLKIENEENFDIDEIETTINKLEYSKLNENNKSLIIREKICYICEMNEDLIDCQGTCHQSFHAYCIGLLNVTNECFKCKECSSGLHACFICKKSSFISENSVTKKCSLNTCSRYYHEDCIKMNELFYKDSLSKYVCPLHTCVTCWSETSKFTPDYDQNEMTSILQPSKGDLYQCIKCPTAYHIGGFCLAAGSLILDGLNIICPKHFQPIKSISQHIRINVNWCFVCCINGDLIGCISCPASYHLKCINNPPSSLISLLKKEEDESFKPNSPPVSSTTESLLNQYSPSSSACSSSIASSSNSNVNTSLNWECEDCVIGKRPVTGEVVWSKAGPYRWWPAEICSLYNLPENLQNKTFQVGEYPVRFFGTNDYYWANIGRCFAFHENDEQFMKQSQLKTGSNKSKSLTVAFNNGVNKAIIAFNHIKKLKLERVNRLAVQYEGQLKFSKKNIQNYHYIKTNRPVGDVTIQKKPISELPFCSCDSKEPNPCGTDNCLNRILKYECKK